MKIPIPPGLEWWRDEDGGAAWLDSLPQLVEECAELWSLRVGEPFPESHVSLVIPVQRGEGMLAVLKINFPSVESEDEAHAIEHWRGKGAVRLLEHDSERRALLVERCVPGTPLWAVADDEQATAIAAGVLRRLWRPPPEGHVFRPLAEESARWAVELPAIWERLGRPFERLLLDEAIAACLDLGSDQGEAVILHQDFHGGNVLRAEREPWLAIDPKPLVGEREFDAGGYLRDRRELLLRSGAVRLVRRRLDALVAELGISRERTRRWGIAHALAWGISAHPPKLEEEMIVAARRLLSS